MHVLFPLVGRKPATLGMTQRALHMLRPVPRQGVPLVRVTMCGRRSAGGGIGKQILTFSEDTPDPRRHVSFEGTELAAAVTCRKCLKAMDRERQG